MSDAPRRRLPLPLDDDDRKALERTARSDELKGRGDLGPSSAKGRAATGSAPGKRADAGDTTSAPVSTPKAAELFSRADLRPQIAPASDLAQAMAEVFSGLDPATRKFVKPSSLLRDFLTRNDAALAKMFRETTGRE